jgi:Protein-arginine deiminase (PAD)
MKIAFVCPREGQLAEWPRTLLLAPGKGVFALGNNLGGSGGDYGGNIELSHPQEDYPIGRILAGSTMGAKLKLFLEAQEKQKPIIADISYTEVQHIDEVLSPGSAEATYIVDPAGAVALLREKFNTAEKQLRGVLFSPDTQRPGLATIWKTAANGIPFIITNLDYDAVIQEWNRFRPTETGGAGGYVRIVGGSSGGQIGIIKNISKATQADANRIGFAGNPAGKMMLEIQYYYDTGSKASANWKVAAPHRASGWYRPPAEGASVVCVEKTLRWGSTTPAIITVKEILEDAAFVAFNETTRPPLIQATAAAAGVSQPTKLPCLFYMHTELGRTFGVAFTPNTANLQWVDSNPCSAQAFGPRDENNKDVLEEGIRSTLPGTSSFIDDWSLYHIRMGEIHCGSSAERLGESSWWKK